MRVSGWVLAGLLIGGTVAAGPAGAQLASRDGAAEQTAGAPHRTRLILKDGTYQVVMSYKVVGKRVEYVSAERGGVTEEIPLELVDLDATKRWEQRHGPGADVSTGVNGKEPERAAPVLDPELEKEEAERATLRPEVAPDLRLAAEDSVLALDTFQGSPELVPLQQSGGDLNRQTGHSIVRKVIQARSSPHQVLELKGEKAAVQMHVPDPAFYVRLDEATDPSGPVMTVDTGGATSSAAVKDERKGPSRYAIVRVDVRQDARVVASFNTSRQGIGQRQEDAMATTTTTLPGGHWAKIVADGPLLFGEYCLVEILGNDAINLNVWDFGVHPTAPENRDVLRPEKQRPSSLERLPRD